MNNDQITINLPDAQVISAEVDKLNIIEPIQTDDQRMVISEQIKHCKQVIKQITELFKDAKKSANDAHKAICAAERKLSDPVNAWIKSAGQQVLSYDAEKERIRREYERQLQAEAEAKAEAERKRLAAIASRCKDEEKKQAYEEAAQSVNVYVPAVAKVDNKAEGEIKSVIWKAELKSFSDLIKAAADGDVNAITCLSFDQSAANKLATAFKRENVISGVAFEKQIRISYRG